MSTEYNEQEQKLLAEARNLRKKAQELRRERSNATKVTPAEKKAKRDAELREFLLPLAQAMVRTGWRIREMPSVERHKAWGDISCAFTLERWNSYPSEQVHVYWNGRTTRMGFEWQ